MSDLNKKFYFTVRDDSGHVWADNKNQAIKRISRLYTDTYVNFTEDEVEFDKIVE